MWYFPPEFLWDQLHPSARIALRLRLTVSWGCPWDLVLAASRALLCAAVLCSQPGQPRWAALSWQRDKTV